MLQTKINSSQKNIISLFNEFYSLFLNKVNFSYLINLYIKKNIILIFNKSYDYILNELHNDNKKEYKITFNDIFFSYIYIDFKEEINNEQKEQINLFLSYLGLFYYNNLNERINLFNNIFDIIDTNVLLLNDQLNIIYYNKSAYLLLEKINTKLSINLNIYDVFSQLEDHIKLNDIYKNKKIFYTINKNNTDIRIRMDISTIKYDELYNIIILTPIINQNKTCDNIGFLSHELRNPLQTITFATELLKIKKENKYINIIDKSTNDMIKIINDILDIDRIESNQIYLNIIDVSLDDILNDIEFSIPKNKNINFTIKKDSNIKFNTDPTRLKQILLNIINNSIKYSRNDTTNNIQLNIKYNEDSINFHISDTGIGIKKDKLSELMELKPSITLNKTNSNGIGLYLCNKLAILLGGSIQIKSEYMNFTEIIFTHPLNISFNNSILQKQIENFKVFDKILIIDSDNLLLSVFKDIIMNLKYKYSLNNNFLIDLCDNVNLVCDMVKLNDYDIIFMDLYVCDINGITLAKLLRKQYYNKKIIGMTTDSKDIYCNDSLQTSIYENVLDENKRKIIQLYDDIMLKPFTENDILDRLKY
jgi:signal transduction histidine kinase/CheY-like chemotaxis protein